MSSTDYDSRRFICSDEGCLKKFQRKSDLSRHERIHNNDRPYPCDSPGCGKAFIQRSALTVHTRTHTGEKPHQCQHENCGKAFSDSSSLARHRRIHSGKRPYECAANKCGKSFCRKTTLTKHERRSHDIITEEGSPVDEDTVSDSEPSPMPTQQRPVKKESISSYTSYLPTETPELEPGSIPPPGYNSEPYYQHPAAPQEFTDANSPIAQFSDASGPQYSQRYEDLSVATSIDAAQAMGLGTITHPADPYTEPSPAQRMLPPTPIHEISPQTQEAYDYDQSEIPAENVPNSGVIVEAVDSVPIIATTVPNHNEYDPDFYWPQMYPLYAYHPSHALAPNDRFAMLTDPYMLYKPSENDPILPSDRVTQMG